MNRDEFLKLFNAVREDNSYKEVELFGTKKEFDILRTLGIPLEMCKLVEISEIEKQYER